MNNLKTYAITALICFGLGFVLGLYVASPDSSKPSSDIVSIITPTHDVQMQTTVKAEDKTVLKKKGVISKATEKDKAIEVTSAAKIKNASGTTYVANELNITTGTNIIVSERPLAEWMSSNSLALGLTAGSLGFGQELRYDITFSRIGKFYTYVELDGFHWIQKYNQNENYSGQVGAFIKLDF